MEGTTNLYHQDIKNRVVASGIFPEKWVYLVVRLGTIFFDHLCGIDEADIDNWTMASASCAILATVYLDRRRKIKEVLPCMYAASDRDKYREFIQVLRHAFQYLHADIVEKKLGFDESMLIEMKQYLTEFRYCG